MSAEPTIVSQPTPSAKKGNNPLTAIGNTISASANTVTSSIGMLNKLVADASARQTIRSKLDMSIFTSTIHQEKAKELTQSRIDIKKYMAQSPEHATLYEQSFEELKAVLLAA